MEHDTARRSNDALADALLRLYDNPSEVLHGWRLTLREAAAALGELQARSSEVSETEVEAAVAAYKAAPSDQALPEWQRVAILQCVPYRIRAALEAAAAVRMGEA